MKANFQGFELIIRELGALEQTLGHIMKIETDWKLSLTLNDVLRGQGMDPQIVLKSKPSLIRSAERAVIDGVPLIHPISLTDETAVRSHKHEHVLLEDGRSLTGPLVTQQLAGARRVFVAVCSIGSELEKEVSRFLSDDPLYALALDGLGNAAVEMLAQRVCSQISEQVQVEGLQTSTPLSPGSPDWPVEVGQPQIFALLDPAKAGIYLSSGGMMVPKKSISLIVGIGLEMSQVGMCEVCGLKETCRYSHG
jgi:hypothetical protein